MTLKPLLITFCVVLLSACGGSTPQPENTTNTTEQKINAVYLERDLSFPVQVKLIQYFTHAISGTRSDAAMLTPDIVLYFENQRGQRLPVINYADSSAMQVVYGDRYRLIYENTSYQNTYELVTSIDGIDVSKGTQASQYNNGYVLHPRSKIAIDGIHHDNHLTPFVIKQAQGMVGIAIHRLKNIGNLMQSSSPSVTAFPMDK